MPFKVIEAIDGTETVFALVAWIVKEPLVVFEENVPWVSLFAFISIAEKVDSLEDEPELEESET